MTTTNRFKKALKDGVPQIGVWSTLPTPYASELIAGVGYDWMMLDTEHTPTDVPTVMQQLQAAAAAVVPHGRQRTAAVVRPAWNDTVLIKRYLDIGVQNVLLPFVQNATEAAAAVAATRYAPKGIRGMGGATRASNFGRTQNYAKSADQDICVLVQVETASALEELDAIASVEGVDGVFIGPADLSASMGYVDDPNHPNVRAAIDGAIKRIRSAGKAPGILMTDQQRAKECLNLGALFVAVSIDLLVLRSGLECAAAAFSQLDVKAEPTSAY